MLYEIHTDERKPAGTHTAGKYIRREGNSHEGSTDVLTHGGDICIAQNCVVILNRFLDGLPIYIDGPGPFAFLHLGGFAVIAEVWCGPA